MWFWEQAAAYPWTYPHAPRRHLRNWNAVTLRGVVTKEVLRLRNVYRRGFGAAQGLFSSPEGDGVALAVNRSPAVLKQAGIYGAVSCALIIVHDNRRAWR